MPRTETTSKPNEAKRYQAQELVWDAMDAASVGKTEESLRLCRQALGVNPDCVDARTMLADYESKTYGEFFTRMREAIEAGRRELGPECFKECKGEFWLMIETRPFMRAMARLADALVDNETPQNIDEAIEIYEEMLDLNPNDNQGVRDWLAGCYLARRRYDDAWELFERYPDDWATAQSWAKVLHAFAVGDAERAGPLLEMARERNPHVEKYFAARKRLPRKRPALYSPGDESEAMYCAKMLLPAWRKHQKARKWLKEQGGACG